MELRKAQREVEAFHRFRLLSQELLEINEEICRARPVADTLSPEEKNGGRRSDQEVTREVDQLLRVVFNGRRQSGRLDLEATEMAVRSVMHQAGAAVLTKLLRFRPRPLTNGPFLVLAVAKLTTGNCDPSRS